MLRFLLPALAIVGAFVLLLAGAVGDLKSLPPVLSELGARFARIVPDASKSTPSSPQERPEPVELRATSTIGPAPGLQQQLADVEAHIKQRSEELASLRGDSERARQELDDLQRQRRAEQTAIADLQSQQRQTAAANPQGKPVQSRPPQQPAQPPTALSQATPAQPMPEISPLAELQNARQLLAAGRTADARQLLVRAQARSALQPVTPESPAAVGTSRTATWIGDAIRWLDVGNPGGALQAIDQVMDNSVDRGRDWPGYSSPGVPGSGYYYGYR